MDVTDATFATDVVERSHDVPVVVDFWADWCGPCRALAPVLEDAVAARNGDVVLAKLDVDSNPESAGAYSVQGIPAVKAFRGGKVVAEFVGAQSRPSVERFLDDLLAPPAAERLVDELRSEQPDVASALEQGRYEEAFRLLLDQVPHADRERRERIRELMVELFSDLGQDDPLVADYRRRLATALF
jgi:putative thioredoxin